MRSEKEQGELVYLYWLWDDLGAAPVSEGGLVWAGNAGEDYARSASQIVVKVKQDVDKYELARRLRKLADKVEEWSRPPVEQLLPKEMPLGGSVALMGT